MLSGGNAMKNGEPRTGFSYHNNAPGHRSVSVKDFLPNNNVTTLGNPQHVPYLVTAFFYLSTQLKPSLEARGFCDTNRHHQECDGRAEKAFTKWLPGLFTNAFTLSGRSVELQKGTTLKKA
jgi:hypothetical protein